jgi:transposase
VIFVGVDWAEAHHDICMLDEDGQVLGRRRIAEGVQGLGELHALVGEHAEEPAEVVVGIEIDRGLLVQALVSAGYQLYAINPLAVSRYRERHHLSGAKSDPGDAKVLADLVRTDRHNHRAIAGDSELSEAIKLLARVHQNAIWGRQRQVNALRSALREYYPAILEAFGTDLDNPDALAVLGIAPTPELGRQLSVSKIVSALRRGGRQPNLERRAQEIQAILRSEYLGQPSLLSGAYGKASSSAARLIGSYNNEISTLEVALSEHFEQRVR